MEIIETFKTTKGIVKIYREEAPNDPRDWSTLSKMICFHKKYNLGDKTDLKSSDFNGWKELHKYIKDILKGIAILPLYLYDHSGITISVNSFSCQFDSGQIGYIYTTEKLLNENGHKTIPDLKTIEKWLIEEVEMYDKYLRGDIYGYDLINISKCKYCKHINEKIIDNCSGFYSITDIKDEFTIIKNDDSLLKAIANGNQKKLDEFDKKVENGETIRIV